MAMVIRFYWEKIGKVQMLKQDARDSHNLPSILKISYFEA